MTRYFSLPFSAIVISAAQDLFEFKVGTKPVTLIEVVFGQSSDYGDAQAEGLQILIKRGIGNTSGSGGTTPTPVAHDSSQTAASATAEVNNTTQATAGTGTLTTIRAETFNVQGGYQYLPIPDERLLFLPNQSCIVSLSAPADAITGSGTLVFAED